MYLYSSASRSAPRRVRAPHTTRPATPEGAEAVDAVLVEGAVLAIVELDVKTLVRR